jgi:hypothetical protein
MRKILNFIVLLIVIKGYNISIFRKNCKQSTSDYYYYFDYYFDESNKTTTLFKKTIYVSYINYEVRLVKAKKNYSFNLWNWQAKFLYKMAQNKYLKS